jgi:hypothetical protein
VVIFRLATGQDFVVYTASYFPAGHDLGGTRQPGQSRSLSPISQVRGLHERYPLSQASPLPFPRLTLCRLVSLCSLASHMWVIVRIVGSDPALLLAI